MHPNALDLSTKFHFHDGAMTVQRTQDCSAIVEQCKEDSAVGNHGSSEMRLAARLPFIIVETYCNQRNLEFREVMNNPAHMKAMLNDPDLAAFRVWKGRV